MRKLVLITGVAALLVVLPACLPSFPAAGVLEVSPAGSGGTITWSRATDLDAGQAIDTYRIDVDGSEVSRIPGSEDSCVLSGLTTGTHQVAVTAYDSNGDWSGSASSGARLTGQVAPVAPAAPGAPVVCEPVAQSSEATIVIDGVTAAAAVGPDFGVTLRDADTSGVPPPDGTELDVDAIGIRVTGLADGDRGRVSLQTDQASDSVRILVDGRWSTFVDDGETGAVLAGDGLTTIVTARDGGRGDDDGAVNGAVRLTLGLGSTPELAGAPNPPAAVELPRSAPGWSEARPALGTVNCGTFCTGLVLFRVNAAGALEYRYALGNALSTFGVLFDTLNQWTEWTVIEGTGPLVGSPTATGTHSVYVTGADGRLRLVANSDATLSTSSTWTVSALPPLPGGLTIVGSPMWGAVVQASDGGLWALSAGSWTSVTGPGFDIDGAATVSTRADGSGRDMWVHGTDHARRRIGYTAAGGWDVGHPEPLGGVWAGSPSSTVLQGGQLILAGIDQSGSIATEVSRGATGSFRSGTGFVGSPVLRTENHTASAINGVVAAVRADGLVTLSQVLTSGALSDPGLWFTVGQPKQAVPQSPADGALITPGASVTMTTSQTAGASGHRWTLYEVPVTGAASVVATQSISGAGSTSWTVPASALRNGARYKWQVEAFRSDPVFYSRASYRYFTVTDGRPPVQTSPSEGADVLVDGSTVVLRAGVVAGATGYRFTLSGQGSKTVTCCAPGETGPSAAFPTGTIVPGEVYTWSVQAVFTNVVGAPGPLRSFTAILNGGPPPAPTLSAPADGAQVSDLGAPVYLSASSPPDGHRRDYRFELWELVPGGRAWAAGFTSSPSHLAPDATWAVPGRTMQANRTYEWTVRIYDHATRQLGSWPQPRTLSTVTDTLGTDQVLLPGNEIRGGGYRLVMQLDGNVVVYRSDGSVKVATNRLVPVGTPYPYLVMQGDGNLVEYQNQDGADRKVIWASGSRGSGAQLVMQADGNAVVYGELAGGGRSARWASNDLIPRPPVPPPLPQPPSPPPIGLDIWKQGVSPLPVGTTSSNGQARALPAPVFQREFGTTTAGNSGQLLTYTLNLAMGKQVNKTLQACGGISNRPRWICFPGRIGSTVVNDLRSNLVPDGPGLDPAIVVTVQEARPVAVDAIASQLSDAFGTKVYTLFVDTHDPSAASRNVTPDECGDGTENSIRYRCEFGNAIISTVPLLPRHAIYFEHPTRPDQDRAFVSATTSVNGRSLVVGTLHGQCLCDTKPPIDETWEQQRDADFELLAAALSATSDPLLIGADWNAEVDHVGALTGTGFAFQGGNIDTNSSGHIDFFLTRPALTSVSLGGTGRDRTLWPKLHGYDFDHARVAVRWQP